MAEANTRSFLDAVYEKAALNKLERDEKAHAAFDKPKLDISDDERQAIRGSLMIKGMAVSAHLQRNGQGPDLAFMRLTHVGRKKRRTILGLVDTSNILASEYSPVTWGWLATTDPVLNPLPDIGHPRIAEGIHQFGGIALSPLGEVIGWSGLTVEKAKMSTKAFKPWTIEDYIEASKGLYLPDSLSIEERALSALTVVSACVVERQEARQRELDHSRLTM